MLLSMCTLHNAGILAPESWWEAWWHSTQRWIQEPLEVRDRDENPQEDPLAVHCFCVCSGSALLGDLGVSRSRECDLLSVLLIYPRIFLHIFIAYRLLVGFLFVWLCSAICSCVLVVLFKLSVLAKGLAIERPLWWHLHEVRILSPQSPGGRVCLCVFFFRLVCLCCYISPPALHNIYFIRLWHNIACLYVLKVPLNTNKTNKTLHNA